MTTSGLTSTATMSAFSTASRESASTTSATAPRSTGGSPRTGPSSGCAARSSSISSASTRSTGTRRNATSARASASTPPTPIITHGPNCGSRSTPAMSSRLPCTIGATRIPTAPSSGTAASSRAVDAARTSSSPCSPSRTRPRSVLWATPSPQSFTTTAAPGATSRAASTASSGVSTTRSSSTGTPAPVRTRFDSCSDRVRLTVWVTPRWRGPARTRRAGPASGAFRRRFSAARREARTGGAVCTRRRALRRTRAAR